MSELNSLKKKLSEKRADLTLTRTMYKDTPEYKEAREIFERTVERIKRSFDSALLSLESEIKDLRRKILLLEESQKDLSFDKFGKEVFDIVNQMKCGVDWGPGGLIPVWISEDKRFFILKNPGHGFFAGRGIRGYAKTSYMLIDKQKFNNSRFCGINRGGLMEIEGRLNKENMSIFEERIKMEIQKCPTQDS